jgi:DNA-binding SARP family transcriptional activator
MTSGKVVRMGEVRIDLLGPFHVEVDHDTDVAFESETARALLAVLAVDPGRPWAREVLAELFWPRCGPGEGLGNLRHTLSSLRHGLRAAGCDAPVLEATRTRVRLLPHRVRVDLAEAERLAAVPATDPGFLGAWLGAASLLRGELLEDLQVHAGPGFTTWLETTRERVRLLAVALLRPLVAALDAAGRPDEALGRALQLVRIERWDEAGHRDVMRLLARAGDAGGAWEHYARLRRDLRDELDMEPAPETCRLAEAIRRHAAA